MDDMTFSNIINNSRSTAAVSQDALVGPRSGERLWDVPQATPADVDAAVSAAQAAFSTWKRTTTAERQSRLRGLAHLLAENKALLSGIIGRETGKSVRNHSLPPPKQPSLCSLRPLL